RRRPRPDRRRSRPSRPRLSRPRRRGAHGLVRPFRSLQSLMAKDEPSSGAAGGFATTRWSMVLAAGKGESPDAHAALARLCQTYWYPLYAFVRRSGHQPADAQDLTQAFFARLLEKRYLQAADPERGRFRSFLLSAVKHFLSKERDRAKAQKRG